MLTTPWDTQDALGDVGTPGGAEHPQHTQQPQEQVPREAASCQSLWFPLHLTAYRGHPLCSSGLGTWAFVAEETVGMCGHSITCTKYRGSPVEAAMGAGVPKQSLENAQGPAGSFSVRLREGILGNHQGQSEDWGDTQAPSAPTFYELVSFVAALCSHISVSCSLMWVQG